MNRPNRLNRLGDCGLEEAGVTFDLGKPATDEEIQEFIEPPEESKQENKNEQQ
jgi:hypothetical protein